MNLTLKQTPTQIFKALIFGKMGANANGVLLFFSKMGTFLNWCCGFRGTFALEGLKNSEENHKRGEEGKVRRDEAIE